MSIFEDYTRCNAVSKTLRFRLIPQGSTADNIERSGFLADDETRASFYRDVKTELDKYHKQHINDRLNCLSLDWSELFAAYRARRQDDEREKRYRTLAAEYRNKISEHIKPKSKDGMTPATIIKAHADVDGSEKLKLFSGFTTYFEQYRVVRENLYKADVPSSVAFRIVDENFPRFAENLLRFEKLDVELKVEADEGLKAEGIITRDLNEFFGAEYFSHVLTQSGIDRYNLMLGGIAEGTIKRKGFNEYCNLYAQRSGAGKIRFNVMYKQILEDRQTRSFVPEAFESDEQLKAAVCEYCDGLVENGFSDLDVLTDRNIDRENVYVEKQRLTSLSVLLFDDWRSLTDRMRASLRAAGKTDKQIEKAMNKKLFSLAEIEGAAERDDIAEVVIGDIRANAQRFLSAYANATELKSAEKISDYGGIKETLDAINDMSGTMKIFAAPSDSVKDPIFYEAFERLYALLRLNIVLYNKVRNYATKKARPQDKFRLNFGTTTLGNGWDKNKERDNLALIFIRDGRYYLGIMNAKNKPKITESEKPIEGAYRKMVYKLLPGPNKMLPKVFFSKSGLKEYAPSDYIINGYKAEKHKKGERFDRKFCCDLIDFYKRAIAQNPDWTVFDFKFAPTEEYKDISEFYNDVARQGYSLRFVYVDKAEIDGLVDRGQLFLFEIYNKDFSEKTTGRKNLHTLYWQEIFSDENSVRHVIRLNGDAELFYRPANHGNPFRHKKDDILIRKTDKNGLPVPDEMYVAAIKAAEEKTIEQLQAEFPSLDFRLAPHDIVKDKRFFEPQFSIHVALGINQCLPTKHTRLNSDVLGTVTESKEACFMGIDRGERNLLYVSVVDRDGNILHQASLNTINGVDYRAKLDEIEKARDAQRKNWKATEKIKDMKTGYLSAAVHEITGLMLKYNAVLVMEDLNFGFKRGRYHIEKQVYQNFEKALIEKLNYLADKDKAPYEPGGIANGYQLTDKFESFEKLGKQTGFVFYVPAAYTSKIDPATGFANVFGASQFKYTSVADSRTFLSKFINIRYNPEKDWFEFEFDYSDFGINGGEIARWTACTCGTDRIDIRKDVYGRFIPTKVDVTRELKDLFVKFGIGYEGEDLKRSITEQSEKDFFAPLLHLLGVTFKLRYEDSAHDFILSPIVRNGIYFDSRDHLNSEHASLPVDGDANGAYHIALQGMRLIMTASDGRIVRDKKGEQRGNWLTFAQQTALKKSVSNE